MTLALVLLILSPLLACSDHGVYLREGFSAHDLSAAILAGESYSVGGSSSGPGASVVKVASGDRESKVDVSVALQRLNFGIEEVTRQLRHEVSSPTFSSQPARTAQVCMSPHLT